MSCYCGVESLSPETNLECKQCTNIFHPACLKSGRPSNLEGDVLFEFICENCSPTKEEQIIRMKLQWSHVLMLTLYNLQLQGGGKCGFYQWREQICDFIEKNWITFYGIAKKRTSTWRGTVAGTLSSGSSTFVSGMSKFNEQGWWALKECRPPTRRDLESCAMSVSAADRKKKKGASCKVESNAKNRKLSPRNKRSKTAEVEESFISLKEESGLASLIDSEIMIDPYMQVDEDLIDISPGSMSPVSLEPSSPSVEGILSQVSGGELDDVKRESESIEDRFSFPMETPVETIKTEEEKPFWSGCPVNKLSPENKS